MKNLYMATTADSLELPCIVGTAKEVAEFIGMTVGSFYCAISRQTKKHGEDGRYHLCKVEVDEE